MRTALTLSPDQFALLASVVRYRGNAVQPHGERFVWQDTTTPRTNAPVRFGWRRIQCDYWTPTGWAKAWHSATFAR